MTKITAGPVAQGDKSSSARNELSAPQRRLWVLERLHPCNPAHNVASAVRLTGRLDVENFKRAWCELVQQYEILRTEFRVVEDMPQAIVLPFCSPLFEFASSEDVARQEREARVLQEMRKETRQAFDLSSAPLLRAFLWRLSALDHVFLVVAHRIVCDQNSLEVLLRQLVLRWARGQSVEMNSVPMPPLQYSEFVSRQREIAEEYVSYWKKKLAGVPPSLDLHTDRPRPNEQTLRGASQVFSIGKPLLDELRELAMRHHATLFATLLAAFNVLLSRYSRQDDIVVGTGVSKRENPEQENLVGPVENVVALRTNLSGRVRFGELLVRVGEVTEEAFSKAIPFEFLLDQLAVERDLSRNPVFQVALQYQVASGPAEVEGLRWEEVHIETDTEALDLTVNITEFDEQLVARFSYSTDLFEPETIARMMGHFRVLLKAATDNPEMEASLMPLLTESERNRLLVEWNETRVKYPTDIPLHKFIEDQVEKTPDSVAVIFESRQLTYRELNNRANQLAHYLRKSGVGPDVLVGVCMHRSLELIVALLGILKAGGAYVPLDPEYPRDRLAAILEDAKAPVLITHTSSADALPTNGARPIRVDADWADIASQPTTSVPCNVHASNLAYVLFTSGSTGRPKGVALEHRSAAVFIQWARDVFMPEELAGTLFSTSICFDLSVFEMFVPLSVGGMVITAQNALELPSLPANHQVTLINTVPSAIAELLRMDGLPSSVQVVNLAGEPLPTILAQQIYNKTAVTKVYNLYGPTEDTTYSTYTLVPRKGEVTIGRPLPHTQAYILDENRQLTPLGVPGELYLAGDGLARGYYRREDLTQERFVPNPFSSEPGARMYRTGDLARFLPDADIQYLGRIDNQVKVRGFRIELGEIETVLARDPSVQSAVVVAREYAPGDKRLLAYIVPSGESISTATLKDLVRKCLPEYMVPSAFEQMKALPLTPNGKVDRRRLPAPQGPPESPEVVQPRDELEVTLVRIWENALAVSKIGIRDDFFDLGGHSLTAARVLLKIKEATGKELPLSSLFRGATVESLAALIRQQQNSADPIVMEIQHGESDRLPFFVIVPPGEESLGYAMLARHMGPEQTVYKVQGHAPIVGNLRPYSKQEMETITEEYVAAMRSVQPHGPYCLGGLCDGTHIAEQLILKLEAEGEEVGLFAIFDTWVMQHSQIRWLWKVDYYRQRLQEMTKMSWSQRLALYKHVAENRIMTAIGKKSARTDWTERYWPENFTPSQFRAPVVLFKRPKQQFYYVNDPEMGWGKRSLGGVELHESEFHHSQILREPHVRQFGETLANWMTRLSGQSRPQDPNERQGSFASADRLAEGS